MPVVVYIPNDIRFKSLSRRLEHTLVVALVIVTVRIEATLSVNL